MTSAHPRIAAVVIGRNEGARLRACLASLEGASPVIYVDSGSTDGSDAHARSTGARVIDLDTTRPFTAARARNAGLAALNRSETDLVQLVDGDCTVEPGWLATASAYLNAHPDTAIACGRRREDHPEASLYNRLCDIEWNTPPGDTRACGGDILARLSALDAAGLYRDDLIAGEEPELCVRLRRQGWKIHRLDAPMTRHDARMTRLGQWWKRTRRAGHAFAEGAHLHGAPPERHWVAETRCALLWGAALPLAILIAGLIHPAALLLTLIYPLQVARLAARRGLTSRAAWEWAAFTVLGKFAEAQGALQFHASRLLRRRATLIEYR
ncbi:MAG: glycosyltransferase [Roseovarius sp.]|uniref:glycosyltransferase n=1 Tax=Roseovarius sp. TaxID=1486281 RepID=UPI0032ED7A29